jgi:hypothetical protein
MLVVSQGESIVAGNSPSAVALSGFEKPFSSHANN